MVEPTPRHSFLHGQHQSVRLFQCLCVNENVWVSRFPNKEKSKPALSKVKNSKVAKPASTVKATRKRVKAGSLSPIASSSELSSPPGDVSPTEEAVRRRTVTPKATPRGTPTENSPELQGETVRPLVRESAETFDAVEVYDLTQPNVEINPA